MGIHVTNATLDLESLCQHIKQWLDGRRFETKVENKDGTIRVSGNWIGSGYIEAGGGIAGKLGLNPLKVDSALHVAMRHSNGETQVVVKQGSWTDNLFGNATWTFVTGGLNIVLSQYGEAVIKELEGFVEELLAAGTPVGSQQSSGFLGGGGMPAGTQTRGTAVSSKTIECPHCASAFVVTRQMVGTRVACTVCGGPFNVKSR
jgi:hypothetical protein